MTPEEWATIEYFKPSEFDSHDEPGTGAAMQYELVHRLDLLRARFGKPVLVVSGIRTPEHNAEVGGVNESAHIGGWAADIVCMGSKDRYRLVRIALILFRRIGIGDSFIHVDLDPTKPQDVIWLY